MFKKLLKYIFFTFFVFNATFAKDSSQIELFIFEDIAYLSLEEFCESQELPYNVYFDKSKIEFSYENQKITFSNNSSFVKIDNQIYHMVKNILLVENKFYAPLNSFVRLYTQFENKSFIVDYNKKTISIADL